MGLRVLVLAHSPAQIQGDKLPTVFRPIAIITLSDNIRPDAIETIKWFRENDVAVKVISGDNPVTVSEVAPPRGNKDASQFLSLEGLSDIEVGKRRKSIHRFRTGHARTEGNPYPLH